MKRQKICRWLACVGALLLLMVEGVAAQRGESVVIPIIAGERWWGIVADHPKIDLPFNRPFVVNGSGLSPNSLSANVLLSNRGRCVYTSKPMTVSYDGQRLVVVPARGQSVALHKGGRTLRESFLKWRQLCPPTPWGVGCDTLLYGAPIYDLGGCGALLYTQDEVLRFANKLLDRGAPVGTILIPLGWSKPTDGAAFDEEVYPDPRAMVDSLHRMGMGVMLTVAPYVMAAGRDYQRLLKERGVLETPNGSPAVFQSRLGYTACRKLTAESAQKWSEELRVLQEEMGVDGFYFDTLDVMPLLEGGRESDREFLRLWGSVARGLEGVIFSSPTGGTEGVFALSPSRHYDWEVLQRSVTRCLQAPLLGYGPTPLAADLEFGGDGRLTLRTAQFAALMPIAIIPSAVWELADVKPLLRVLGWRVENRDYLLWLAAHSAATGEPMVRNIEYQFPRTGFVNCNDEYMLGPEWLVAPAMGPGDCRMVRLPRGTWMRWPDGRVFKGPRVIDLDISGGGVALFRRVK